MMAVQIGAKPDSGFDDPIGMLTDCHRRIENFLRFVCVVAERSSGKALSQEESAAVQASLHYFRSGGQRHTADEEESLFPRLRASIGTVDLANVAELEEDHNKASALHDEVDTLCTRWIEQSALNKEDQERLASATSQLKQLYAEHIRIEESVVFPLAALVLDRESVEAIGKEFRARRE